MSEPIPPIIGEGRYDEAVEPLDPRVVAAMAGHDHDPGGCTCGCPIDGCPPCGGFRGLSDPEAPDA